MIKATTEEIAAIMAKYNLPEYMVNGVYNYFMHHIKPGAFLTAVLMNNLKEAVNSADSRNLAALEDWVRFMYWEAPLDSWGAEKTVEEWCKVKTNA